MGHGHVTPNADGSRARCGGPALCSKCQAEKAALEHSLPAVKNEPPPMPAVAPAKEMEPFTISVGLGFDAEGYSNEFQRYLNTLGNRIMNQTLYDEIIAKAEDLVGDFIKQTEFTVSVKP